MIRTASVSLRARALAHLARRDHSRVELARKLAPHASDEQELAQVLDALEQAGYLSAQRFVESLIRRRSAKYGLRRVEQELAEHKIEPELKQPMLDALKGSEAERAWQAWERRFDAPPADLKERARQQRFLAGRGFTGEAVSAVFKRLKNRP